MNIKWYYIPVRLKVLLALALLVVIARNIVPQYIPMWVGVMAGLCCAVITGIILDKYKPKDATFMHWWRGRRYFRSK